MNDEITKLRDQVAPLQARIWELEDAERMHSLSALVGRCFVYSNSYSGDHRWPLYQKIVESGGRLYALRAQNDLKGSVEIECKELHSYADPASLGREITEQEYQDGVKSCMEWAQRHLNGEPPPSE